MVRSGTPSRVTGAALAMTLLAAATACGGRDSSSVTETATPTSAPSPSRTAASPSPAPTVDVATASISTVVPETPPVGTQSPPPSPTPLPPMDAAQISLKYALFDRFGRLWWCDPDFYPIAREDEQVLADQRFPEIERDPPALAAIVTRLGIPPQDAYTPEQKLAIYRDWKVLRAIELQPTGDLYEFNDRFTRDEQTGVLAVGTIDRDSRITVVSEESAEPPMCPICLTAGTLIATPHGAIPVQDLRAGMAVWTAAADGTPLRAEVLAIGSMPVPASHRVTHLVLADGRSLRASPAHPLADGRLLGDITPGDVVDGSIVITARLEPYDGSATFDLLPSGPTGSYWANGVLLDTTLIAPARPAPPTP